MVVARKVDAGQLTYIGSGKGSEGLYWVVDEVLVVVVGLSLAATDTMSAATLPASWP
jgi:hypothetical protein